MHMLQQMGILALLSLTVAVVPAVMGVAYALWPTEAKLALMRPLSLASLFGALAGFVAGVINCFHWAAANNASFATTAFVGFSEALVPLFVSFGSLTVAWLLVALGMRRTQ
jgi:hypothetical protein